MFEKRIKNPIEKKFSIDEFGDITCLSRGKTMNNSSWSGLWMLCFVCLLCFSSIPRCGGFQKVIVPSVYKEWVNGMPDWMTSVELKHKYNYTTFLYQKLDPKEPNYVPHNRGTEGGIYLKYIVDHYQDFPDIAVFVHADPQDHQKHWLEMVGCISPNASYMNINFNYMYRSTIQWQGKGEQWIEQCFRDVLGIVWDKTANETARVLPPSRPIQMSFSCCNQFVISRAQVYKRPLSTWKALLHVILEQDVCHIGEPDYNHLFAYTRSHKKKGPELPHIAEAGEKPGEGYGYHTQGGAMEHLAHVIFGLQPLDMAFPTQKEICQHFIPHCPHSPCKSKH